MDSLTNSERLLYGSFYCLTFVTGLIDAGSYVAMGHVFTANMTGNIGFMGFALGGAPGLPIKRSAIALGFALIGGFLAGRLDSWLGKKHRNLWLAVALATEAVLLLGAMSVSWYFKSVFDAFRPLPHLCCLAVAAGYCVLGGGWLFLKSNQLLLRFAVRILRIATGAFVSVFLVACLAAVRVQPAISSAWTSHYLSLSIVSVLFVVLLIFLGSTTANTPPLRPLLSGTGLFLMGLVGIVVIIYPKIIPFQLTLWDAAASSASQKFVLIGVACVAPVVLAYSSYAYWVFRGRTPAKGWSE